MGIAKIGVIALVFGGAYQSVRERRTKRTIVFRKMNIDLTCTVAKAH